MNVSKRRPVRLRCEAETRSGNPCFMYGIEDTRFCRTHWGCGIFGSISTGNESYEEVMAAVVEKFGSVIPVEILREIEELHPREVVCRQCASRYNPARWLPAHCPDCGHSLERG